jgi:hypothetical protein
MEDGASDPLVGWPAPASDPFNRTERPGVCSGVGASAVLFSLEHDVDLTSVLYGRFEVRCELGERVRRETDEQYALACVGDEFVQDRAGEALLAGGAGSGPDRA